MSPSSIPRDSGTFSHDDEVTLAETIKSIAARLANSAVTLDSFFISTTEHQKSLGWSQRTVADLEARHILIPDVSETKPSGGCWS